jgi:hypothetical protein
MVTTSSCSRAQPPLAPNTGDYEAKVMLFHDQKPKWDPLIRLNRPDQRVGPVHHATKDDIVNHIVQVEYIAKRVIQFNGQ